MAMNSLYDCWTIRQKSELTFDDDTPAEVKEALDEGKIVINFRNKFFVVKNKSKNEGTKLLFFRLNEIIDKQSLQLPRERS